MGKLQRALSGLPSWIFTILTTLLILWLTLAPNPLGDNSPKLFQGADKIVHGMMFGFLTLMILLDRIRRNGWVSLSKGYVFGASAASAIFGALVEVAQLEMQLGRGFEWEDILADTLGCVICGLAWLSCQRRFTLQ